MTQDANRDPTDLVNSLIHETKEGIEQKLCQQLDTLGDDEAVRHEWLLDLAKVVRARTTPEVHLIAVTICRVGDDDIQHFFRKHNYWAPLINKALADRPDKRRDVAAEAEKTLQGFWPPERHDTYGVPSSLREAFSKPTNKKYYASVCRKLRDYKGDPSLLWDTGPRWMHYACEEAGFNKAAMQTVKANIDTYFTTRQPTIEIQDHQTLADTVTIRPQRVSITEEHIRHTTLNPVHVEDQKSNARKDGHHAFASGLLDSPRSEESQDLPPNSPSSQSIFADNGADGDEVQSNDSGKSSPGPEPERGRDEPQPLPDLDTILDGPSISTPLFFLKSDPTYEREFPSTPIKRKANDRAEPPYPAPCNHKRSKLARPCKSPFSVGSSSADKGDVHHPGPQNMLLRDALQRVLDEQWLSSEAVVGMLSCALDTNTTKVLEETFLPRSSRQQSLGDFDTFVLPFNIGGIHWIVVIVDIAANTATLFDSLPTENEGLSKLRARIEALRLCQALPLDEDWDLQTGCATQQNGDDDCGVHAITNALFWIHSRNDHSETPDPFLWRYIIYWVLHAHNDLEYNLNTAGDREKILPHLLSRFSRSNRQTVLSTHLETALRVLRNIHSRLHEYRTHVEGDVTEKVLKTAELIERQTKFMKEPASQTRSAGLASLFSEEAVLQSAKTAACTRLRKCEARLESFRLSIGYLESCLLQMKSIRDHRQHREDFKAQLTRLIVTVGMLEEAELASGLADFASTTAIQNGRCVLKSRTQEIQDQIHEQAAILLQMSKSAFSHQLSTTTTNLPADEP